MSRDRGTANGGCSTSYRDRCSRTGFTFLIELDFLKPQRLQGRRVEALLHYA